MDSIDKLQREVERDISRLIENTQNGRINLPDDMLKVFGKISAMNGRADFIFHGTETETP